MRNAVRLSPIWPAEGFGNTRGFLETSAFSNCLRQPDNLLLRPGFEARTEETHGFASLSRDRFAIYRVQSLQKIVAAPDNLMGATSENIKTFLRLFVNSKLLRLIMAMDTGW